MQDPPPPESTPSAREQVQGTGSTRPTGGTLVSLANFELPAWDTVIWRYIDFTKYTSMVATSTVWFARADTLGDPFEGSRSALDGLNPALDDIYSKLGPASQAYRLVQYVNCWNIAGLESAALWATHAPRHGDIALRSTVARLVQALEDSSGAAGLDFIVAPVKYVDYSPGTTPAADFVARLFHKRLSFKHEQELRAILFAAKRFWGNPDYWLPDHSPNLDRLPRGIPVTVDLASLVDTAFVSPASPSWQHDAALMLTRRFGLEFPVIQSDMDATPTF